MTARKITSISARPQLSVKKCDGPLRRRVAGYARVSTSEEEQMGSYEQQVRFYTDYIKSNPEWEFAGMYADKGISGTQIKNRVEFNRMINDAMTGKIDLILTKSVSRFARNTVDSLMLIRKLKENHIEVYFEKENIYTFDAKGELMLTIISSIAQEESRSISENTKWGWRHRFAEGQYHFACKNFLGYDRGDDGRLTINPAEAETVRLIYRLFLEGSSYHSIATELTRRGLKTVKGNDHWIAATVHSILTNEKYKGDVLLQKTYVADYLTHKCIPNEGAVPQYYIHNDHEAIIDPLLFDRVQFEILQRSREKRLKYGNDSFSGMIHCMDCGGWYGPKVWHSNSWYSKVVYQCNKKYQKDKPRCSTQNLAACTIRYLFLLAYNQLAAQKEDALIWTEQHLQMLGDTAPLEEEKEQLEQTLYKRAIAYSDAKHQIDALRYRIWELNTIRQELTEFQHVLQTIQPLPSFDAAIWKHMVDRLQVWPDDSITVIFKGGYAITLTPPFEKEH